MPDSKPRQGEKDLENRVGLSAEQSREREASTADHDLPTKLREPAGQWGKSMVLCREAATEIERLRTALNEIKIIAARGQEMSVVVGTATHHLASVERLAIAALPKSPKVNHG